MDGSPVSDPHLIDIKVGYGSSNTGTVRVLTSSLTSAIYAHQSHNYLQYVAGTFITLCSAQPDLLFLNIIGRMRAYEYRDMR